MNTGTAVRGWGRWPRPLILVGLLTIGTACGGSGDHASSADVNRGAATGRTAEAPAAVDGQKRLVPAPPATGPGRAPTLGAGPGRDPAANLGTAPGAKAVPPPPPPAALAGRPPQAPPNTVSLDTLHRQGRTHVLR